MSELIDNRARRVGTLKHVIRHLHEGRAPAEVQAQLAQLVRECDAGEIASMEQDLMAEGIPAQEIMSMCDLHSQVVRDVLVERAVAPPAPGHPVDTFRRENEALAAQVRALRAALRSLAAADAPEEAAVDPQALLECLQLYNGLMDVDKHYQRKEHLLFSCLERHGITGPSTVMWGKDDEVRALLKALGEALAAGAGAVGEWRVVSEVVAEPALAAVEEMIFKEEKILLPMSLENLTPAEWGEIWSQSPQFGYCLVDPRAGYQPPGEAAVRPDAPRPTAAMFAAGARAVPLGVAGVPTAALSVGLPGPAAAAASRGPLTQAPGAIVLPTGALSLEQLKAIFSVLPVDLTFVDADDRVRFFSEGRNRVFSRAKAVIGRRVQHCHPPASVHVVERILGDFRSRRQDVAEFWIDLRGRFVHIRYFAVRDANSSYLGCLEVTQDLTRERALEGQRRLLQYDDRSGPAA